MKSIKQIRRENLTILKRDRFNGIQADLAAALDQQPNVISRAINTEAQDHRPIGDKFARSIEQKLELPENWMDADRENDGIELDRVFEVREPKPSYNTQPRDNSRRIMGLMHAAGMDWIKNIEDLIDKANDYPDMTDAEIGIQLGRIQATIEYEWFANNYDPRVAVGYFRSLGKRDEDISNEDILGFINTQLSKSS